MTDLRGTARLSAKCNSAEDRWITRIVVSLLVLCLVLGVRTAEASAASRYKTGMYQVTASTLNIRSGPGVSTRRIGTLKKGEICAVSEIRNTRWGKISYQGKTGWIHLGYTKKYTPILAAGNHMVAHRGYWTTEKEQNTAKAFQAAGKAGFWGIECDLRADEKGNLFTSHDTQICKGACDFETYLDICQQYGAVALIDLKWGCENQLEDMVKLVEKKGMLDQAIFQCSIERYLKKIRDASKKARVWFLCSSDERVAEALDVVKRVKAEAINMSKDLTNPSDVIKKWKSTCKVCVYNLDTKALRKKFDGYGAYYTMTNKP